MKFDFISVLIPWIFASVLLAVLVSGAAFLFFTERRRRAAEMRAAEVRSNEHARCLEQLALSCQGLEEAVDRTGRACTLLDGDVHRLLAAAAAPDRENAVDLHGLTASVGELIDEKNRAILECCTSGVNVMAQMHQAIAAVESDIRRLSACMEEDSLSQAVYEALRRVLDEQRRVREEQDAAEEQEAHEESVTKRESSEAVSETAPEDEAEAEPETAAEALPELPPDISEASALAKRADELEDAYRSCLEREADIRRQVFETISDLYNGKGSDSVEFLNDTVQSAIDKLNKALDD